jgi:hypothetical protein
MKIMQSKLIFLLIFSFTIDCGGDGSGLKDFIPPECSSVSLGSPVTIYEGYVYPQPIDLVKTDDGFGAIWNSDGLWFARIDSSGNLVGVPSVLDGTDADSNWPSMYWTGENIVVTYFQQTDTGGVVEVLPISPDGQVLASPIHLTDGTSSVYDSIIVGGDGGLAAIWLDDRHSSPDAEVRNDEIYFQSLNTDGTPEGSGIRITESEGTTLDPDIAYSGGLYAISFVEKSPDREKSRRHQGQLLLVEEGGSGIGSPIEITKLEAGIQGTSVVASGGHFAVSFSSKDRTDISAPNDKLEIVLVEESSASVLSRTLLNRAQGGVGQPQLSWNGSWYSVGFTTDSEEVGRLLIMAVEPDVGGASAILDVPLDVYNGLVRIEWSSSSVGILSVAKEGEDLKVQFRLGVCSVDGG